MIEWLDRFNAALNRILLILGGLFLVAMVGLTCANICLRLLWVPVRGTFELMGLSGAMVTACALGATQMRRGHIAVDFLVNTFSKQTRQILRVLNSAACTVFFAVATWQMVLKAGVLRETGEVTETLRIIYYPFTYGVALGCAVLTLVFMAQLLRSILPEKGVRA